MALYDKIADEIVIESTGVLFMGSEPFCRDVRTKTSFIN